MIFTGGNLTILSPGDNFLYGNSVIWRSITLDRGARKSFVDFYSMLPYNSRVLTFYIYTRGSAALRLQIWRPADSTRTRWQLVWQQQVVTTASEGLYSVSTLSKMNNDFDDYISRES